MFINPPTCLKKRSFFQLLIPPFKGGGGCTKNQTLTFPKQFFLHTICIVVATGEGLLAEGVVIICCYNVPLAFMWGLGKVFHVKGVENSM